MEEELTKRETVELLTGFKEHRGWKFLQEILVNRKSQGEQQLRSLTPPSDRENLDTGEWQCSLIGGLNELDYLLNLPDLIVTLAKAELDQEREEEKDAKRVD